MWQYFFFSVLLILFLVKFIAHWFLQAITNQPSIHKKEDLYTILHNVCMEHRKTKPFTLLFHLTVLNSDFILFKA